MVINGRWDDRAVTLSTKPNCLTVSLQAGGGSLVASYDRSGRLWTALLDGVSYRRGLDGKIVAKWQDSADERQRRWLPPDEALLLEERLRKRVAGLWAALQSGAARLEAPLPESACQDLEQALRFDSKRPRDDAAHYHQVYQPVGILPPDQYMAVVLQATEGCSFNTCTFCNFYRDRPFRIQTPPEFRRHAEAVRDFLGAGLSLRRTIFLGDANALVTPMPRLLPLMEVVHQVYDVEALGGLYAFLDGFSGEKKTIQDFRRLSESGLRRVYVGLESGSAPLLRFLKKPGAPEDALHAVQAMKTGGVAVGLIILLGAGGHTYAWEHVRETIRIVNAMQLDADDLIYFSELVESEGLPYMQDAYQAGLQPLSPPERLEQGEEIEAGLKFSEPGGTPHISRYDIREFVY